jgi:hypothetical protein
MNNKVILRKEKGKVVLVIPKLSNNKYPYNKRMTFYTEDEAVSFMKYIEERKLTKSKLSIFKSKLKEV